MCIRDRLLSGTELQIIDNFKPTEDWLLGPGDMLYLPPGIGHWGVAEDACMTFSIGFRSPLLSDMLADLAVELSAQGLDRHYRDPTLRPAMAQTQIDPVFVAHAKSQLLKLLDHDELVADWFARYMTAPKYADLLEVSGERRRANVMGRGYLNGEPLARGRGNRNAGNYANQHRLGWCGLSVGGRGLFSQSSLFTAVRIGDASAHRYESAVPCC